jgi:hypothetical protein
MHPIITIFCAFTRRWAVETWLDDLASIEHDPALTNLCFIVDADDAFIMNKLRHFATSNNYRSFHSKMNEQWSPNEVRIAVRRLRIADVKNQSKDLIEKTDGEFILGFEDDTIFKNLDIMRLIQPMLDDDKVGFVEGVQCGRWGVKMIGAWRFDDYENPHHVETLLPGEGYQEIFGGGGWYGYATRRSLYLNCEYYASSAQPWGPDVNYGLWLYNRGYCCLIDWTTVFGHNDHNKVLWPNDKLTKVSYAKNSTNGKWDRTDYEQT